MHRYCHSHVAGYDLVTDEAVNSRCGSEETVGLENVRVWHCNDAKAERGSRLIVTNIRARKIGLEVFRALLNDRLKHPAFIAETPLMIRDDCGILKR